MPKIHVAALVGAALFLNVYTSPVYAARRRNTMENFCSKSYDLCVFTCTSGIDCPSASDGYICESRHGSLAVEENGEITYYEADYSLCWHESRPPADDLPDPEYMPVPRWPGDGERAMCMGCQRDWKVCNGFAQNFQEMCIEHNTRYYLWTCDKSMYRDKVPRGKNGKKVDVGAYCDRRLRSKKRNDEFHVHTDWDAYVSSLDGCEKLALEICLDEYKEDHPDSTTQNTIEVGVEYVLKAGFKSVKEVHWGGNKGFYSACVDVGSMMDNECTKHKSSCIREVSPDKLCRYYRGK